MAVKNMTRTRVASILLLVGALPALIGCAEDQPPPPVPIAPVIADESGAEDTVEPQVGAGAAQQPDVIRIPLHDWSSQLVSAEVVGAVLTEAGFPVEYVPIDSQEVYQAMCDGEIEFVHEVWEPAFGVAFQEQLDKGCVLDWATHDAVTREEWWYPIYVEEQCPGLPNWEALAGCASIFATEETGDKGRYLAGLPDWEYGDAERIEALGLNFEVVHVTSAAQLWIELEAASADQTPIVLLNWTPNFVEAVYDGRFVEFPAYDDACTSDPEWGLNPDLTHDCGGPSAGYLKTGASAQFPARWPAAALIVKRVNFTNAMLAEMAAAVDVRGRTPAAAAQDWMAANDTLWRSWITG